MTNHEINQACIEGLRWKLEFPDPKNSWGETRLLKRWRMPDGKSMSVLQCRLATDPVQALNYLAHDLEHRNKDYPMCITIHHYVYSRITVEVRQYVNEFSDWKRIARIEGEGKDEAEKTANGIARCYIEIIDEEANEVSRERTEGSDQ